jgi:hypothetical protein
MQQMEINPLPREDLLRDLRALAARSAPVRELVHLIQARLEYGPNVLIPVLFYLRQAFNLELIEILPIREWLGSDQDDEIDALILPLIVRNRTIWHNAIESVDGTAGKFAVIDDEEVTSSSGGEHGPENRT